MIESKLLELENKRKKINNEISRLEIKQEKSNIDIYKKKYEGKFFKYKNSYSLPEKKSDYWYDYYYVIKVKGKREIEVFLMYKDSRGIISFENDKTAGSIISRCQKISRSVFMKKYESFQSQIKKQVENF